ncbi:unnamed protein product [Toxocara canis]|uniref:17-beta-hydroxysteroid dehydrogenase 13 n=1 Tax=Toxocara canis TaxID=6265 RepID=A0A183ULS6_TOXCA|nr:unnamed protein product [Toxocara canis]
MGRESMSKQIYLSVRFLFELAYCLIFRDLPRVLCLKRKSVENQVVVITGGARGVGKGLARKFAIHEHAVVCILDINEAEGCRTAAEINNEGGTAHFFSCDVSDPESLRSCAKNIYSSPDLGRVDILICNAAILRIGQLLALSDNDFRTTMNVNVLGYIFAIKSFLGEMIQRNKGQIVAIASICSHYGENLGSAYCTSKFAIRGLMESLQMELDEMNKTGITITTIYPYFIDTPFLSEKNMEPFSTFYDVIPLDECVEEMTNAILKERLTHFIPWQLAVLCTYFKW